MLEIVGREVIRGNEEHGKMKSLGFKKVIVKEENFHGKEESIDLS